VKLQPFEPRLQPARTCHRANPALCRLARFSEPVADLVLARGACMTAA